MKTMHVYLIEAERAMPVKDDKQEWVKEQYFVEATGVCKAVELNPENDSYKIKGIARVGNIIAREDCK